MGRAQAHTLEGVVAGLVLLSGLVFALQATAVTPLSASTSSQHIENQLQANAEGVLAAADSGSPGDAPRLKRAVLFWDPATGSGAFHCADNADFYTNFANSGDDSAEVECGDGPPNEFLGLLDQAFAGDGIAYNVDVLYQEPSGDISPPQRMVYRGEPSDNAVTASRLVTLYEDDVLYSDPNGDGTADPTEDVVASSDFYVSEDVDGPTSEDGTEIYNVVEVEVTVWRM